ncbi:lytic transglycosylase domain-containing protein [Enterobacteriaceae bacterium ML5]|nr:lytic transglycosylase domain-containing protein [Enterobacteriaceae bacterium ML5]
MAASIIDALVITLGLDTRDYDKKRKDVEEGMKDARDDASKTAKELETQGKKAASFFSSIKTELLALAGVSLTIGGLNSFVKNTTNDLMNLSIQSQALGMSAQALDGWSKAATDAGSSAEKITGTLGAFQTAIQQSKFGNYSSPIFEALRFLHQDTGVNLSPAGKNSEQLFKSTAEALQKEKNVDRARELAQRMGIDDATFQSIRSGKFVSNAQKYTQSSQISDQSLKAAREFNSAWTELGQNFDNLKNELFTGLIPTIRDLNDLMIEWSKNNDQVSGFWRSLKKDVLEITGIDLGKWTLSSDLKDLKTNLLEFGSSITHLSNALNAINNGNFSEAASELKKAWYGTENGKPNGKDALPGVTSAATKEAKDSPAMETYRELNDSLNKILPEWLGGTSAQKKHQNDEKSFWSSSQGYLSKIANILVTPAGAAETQPAMLGYQPNIPLNPETAKLGAKGKALLDMMTGSFGKLEGQYGLPAGLLRSVATTESGGDPYAKSKAGAEGLFQFMPGTAKDMGLKGAEVNDPAKSAEAAAKYLSQLLSQTGGDLNSALAAYNWGIGNVKRKGLENAPEETRNYVPKVLAGLRPGSGMAVDNRSSTSTSGSVAPQYHISVGTIASPAQSISQLTDDITKRANNRVRLLGYNTGQQ